MNRLGHADVKERWSWVESLALARMGIDYATAARPTKKNQSPAVLVARRVSAFVDVDEKTLLYVSRQQLLLTGPDGA